MTTDFHQIPTLSLADQGHDPEGFAQAFGASFRRFGFAVVTDHGIDPKLIDTAWKATRQLLNCPKRPSGVTIQQSLQGNGDTPPLAPKLPKMQRM